MPDMDGIQALQDIRDAERKNWIKTGKEHKEIKIMMVTSHSKKGLVLGCAKSGANSYVVKPFNKNIIVEKLEAMGFAIWLFGMNGEDGNFISVVVPTLSFRK